MATLDTRNTRADTSNTSTSSASSQAEAGQIRYSRQMKKIQLNPLVLLVGVVVVAGVSFNAGKLYQVPVRNLDWGSLGQVYGLLQRNFDGKVDDSKALDGAK